MRTNEEFHSRSEPTSDFSGLTIGNYVGVPWQVSKRRAATTFPLHCMHIWCAAISLGGFRTPSPPPPALLLHTTTSLDHMPSAGNLLTWGLSQKPSSDGSSVTSLRRKLEPTSLHSDSVPSAPSSISFTSPAPCSSKPTELFVQSSNRHK